MGQSTDAILFYGYVWSEGREDFTDDDWEASESAKEEFGVEFGTHCSCDYPIPYIYISESKTTASRGFPERIDMQWPSGQHKWDVQLQAVIDKYSISLAAPEYDDAPQGPGWFLVSNWC